MFLEKLFGIYIYVSLHEALNDIGKCTSDNIVDIGVLKEVKKEISLYERQIS